MTTGLIESYLRLRRIIGLLGLLLPALLAGTAAALDGQALQPSLSAYYHTGARDLFVLVLGAIGVALLAYRGHDRSDVRATRVAGLCALAVALLPTEPALGATAMQQAIGAAHATSAGAFFTTMGYISLVLFRRTDQPHPTAAKLRRNRVYAVAGTIVLGCVIALGALHLVAERSPLVFWIESLAVMAFGAAWLVKGEAIMADDPLAR